MGAARKKRERFLSEHPICCFCGGATPATTIDHTPARTCFPDRQAPEGYEFPACGQCQVASRLDELAFGFFVKLADPDDANYRGNELEKAVVGLRNNLPHLLPNLKLSSRDVRNSLREMGLEKPSNMLASDLPLAGLPAATHHYVLRYAWKLSLALYYREQGRIAKSDHYVWASWTQASNKRGVEALEAFIQMTPSVVKGSRRNVAFGDRFGYRCNKADSPDVFAALAQFGSGMILAMLVVDASSRARMTHDHDWTPVRKIFEPM